MTGNTAEKRALSVPAHYALAGIGGVALLVFCLMVLRTHRNVSSDFDQIYIASIAWRHGVQPYNPGPGMFQVPDGPSSAVLGVYYYAPLCSMLAAPISLLPFPLVCMLWQITTYALVLSGLWRFSRLVLPDWAVSLRLFALGITALAGSIRWNLVQIQPTAMVVGLLIWFACMTIEKKWNWSLLLGALISIKLSYMLPVVGLLLFRGQGKRLAVLLALIAVLNGVSLLRTGPAETIRGYRTAMQNFEDPGNMTYPSALDFLIPYLYSHPDSPLASRVPKDRAPGQWAGEMVHMTFTLSAWTPTVALAKALSLLFTMGAFVFLAVIWQRSAKTSLNEDTTFLSQLFATLMALSLLIVYHQRYDAVALLPLAYVAVAALRRRRGDAAAWLALGSTFIFSYVLSAGMLTKWQAALVVPRGLLILTPICGYLALAAFLGAAGMLWRTVREASTPLSA